MSSFKMPYSNFHELNLDWMLEEFKKFASEMDEKIETFDEFQTAWQEFQNTINNRLTAYEAAMEAYKNLINNQITEFENNINEDFNDFKSEMQNQYNDFIENYLETLGVVQETGTSTTSVMSQKAVTDIIENHESRLDEIETIEDNIESRITVVEEVVSAIEEDLDNDELDIANLKSDNLVNQTKINTLENNDASTRARVSSLENRASQDEINISNISARVTTTENDISSLEELTETLNNDNISNKSRISALENEIPTIKNRIATLETDNTSNKTRITNNENNISTLNNKTSELTETTENLTDNVTEIYSVLSDKTAEDLIRDRQLNFTYYGENLVTKLNLNANNPYADMANRIRNGNIENVYPGDYFQYNIVGYGAALFYSEVAGIDTNNTYINRNNHYIDFILRNTMATRTGTGINPGSTNNGYPDQTITLTGDGTTTDFIINKKYNKIDKITINSVETENYEYNKETQTVSFYSPPENESEIKIIMYGENSPWKASRLYLNLNGLSGNYSYGRNDIRYVSYEGDGIIDRLPQQLSENIMDKIIVGEYKTNSTMTETTSIRTTINMGKIWLPTQFELTGITDYTINFGEKQYQLFKNLSTIKTTNAGTKTSYWTLTTENNNSKNYIFIDMDGYTSVATSETDYRIAFGFRM